MFRILLIVLISICVISCQKQTNTSNEIESTSFEGSLFTLLDPSQTGVSFTNTITEEQEDNLGNYDYFYNGSGLAIGDVNNDGLTDLFFTGNQVDNALYINKGDLKFEDVSKKAGLSSPNWSTGALMVDINNDGWLDIYVCNSGPYKEVSKRTNQLYINNKNGTFTEKAKEYGIADNSKSTQASFFDYDRDGDLDLFVLNHTSYFNQTIADLDENVAKMSASEYRKHSCSLYRNDGTKFTDVTKAAGVLKISYGLGLITNDFNHDGLVDIYVANDFHIPDFMYINNGDGTFTDRIKERTGHVPYYSMGCDAGDINNDGLLDLANLDMSPEDHVRNKMLMSSMNLNNFRYLINNEGYVAQYMFNTLQINNGFGIFSEIGLYAGVSQSDWSWAALLADFDNDGYKDYFISNGFKRDTKNNDWRKKVLDAKEKNKGVFSSATYWKLLQEAESNPIENVIYKNNKDYTFSKKTSAWGLNQKLFSNGASYADLDQDGDLELIVNNIDSPASIYKNNASEGSNNYIRFQLQNVNNPAVLTNAKLTIFKGSEKQYVEYHTVHGFQSSTEDQIHFGIGNWNKVDRVEIKWLNGTLTTVLNPSINQTHVIDFQTSTKTTPPAQSIKPPFIDITKQQAGLTYKHAENEFDDFEKEILLPHMQSTLGPFLSVGDANGDGLEDFFVGGAKGQSGELYFQFPSGKFGKATSQPWASDRNSEDMGSLFFDVDNDGDQDLYVASGGGADFKVNDPSLQDRLYVNDGKGTFSKLKNGIPQFYISTGRISANDFDKDGDLDLFIGGRTTPGKYPYPVDAFLLKNEGGKFVDVTSENAPEFKSLGMVTDAVWSDFDKDGDDDLIAVGEWMPISIFENDKGKFQNISKQLGLDQSHGWWYSINVADFNNDGKEDFVIGNVGDNNKFHPKSNKPLHVYCNDFDDNGSLDIVLSKSYKNNLVPVRGKECSTEQMPALADKFPSFKSFSNATLTDLYGEDKLNEALHYSVESFSSILLLNTGTGFSIEKLPSEAQFAPINATVVKDFDGDGNQDIVATGNYYKTEAETPKYDASKGLFLKGNGDGSFETSVKIADNGLFIPGDAKDAQLIHLGSKRIPTVLVSNNDSSLQMFMQTSK